MSFELDNYSRPHVLICLDPGQKELASYLTACNFEVIDPGVDHIYKAINEKAYDFCIFSATASESEPGLNFVKAVRKNVLKVPIIYIAETYDFDELATAFSFGADDYIAVPFNYDELAYRMRAIIRRTGIKLISPAHTYDIGRFIFEVPNNLLVDRWEELDDITLTPKVAQILTLLCMHNGEVVPREMIVSRVWHESNYYTQRGLDVYIATIRKYFRADANINLETHVGIGFSLNVNI